MLVEQLGMLELILSTKDLCCLLLYGKPNGSKIVNSMILDAKISFIKSSKRFA